MDNIGFLLMQTSKELRYTLNNEFSMYGLTTSQWAVLKRLEMEEACESPLNRRTAVELASKLDIDKPTISGIVNRLYEKGMIRKGPHPTDKRAFILFLTLEAKQLIPTLEAVSNHVINQSLIDFSVEEKDLFLHFLKKMECTLSKGGKR